MMDWANLSELIAAMKGKAVNWDDLEIGDPIDLPLPPLEAGVVIKGTVTGYAFGFRGITHIPAMGEDGILYMLAYDSYNGKKYAMIDDTKGAYTVTERSKWRKTP